MYKSWSHRYLELKNNLLYDKNNFSTSKNDVKFTSVSTCDIAAPSGQMWNSSYFCWSTVNVFFWPAGRMFDTTDIALLNSGHIPVHLIIFLIVCLLLYWKQIANCTISTSGWTPITTAWKSDVDRYIWLPRWSSTRLCLRTPFVCPEAETQTCADDTLCALLKHLKNRHEVAARLTSAMFEISDRLRGLSDRVSKMSAVWSSEQVSAR